MGWWSEKDDHGFIHTLEKERGCLNDILRKIGRGDGTWDAAINYLNQLSHFGSSPQNKRRHIDIERKIITRLIYQNKTVSCCWQRPWGDENNIQKKDRPGKRPPCSLVYSSPLSLLLSKTWFVFPATENAILSFWNKIHGIFWCCWWMAFKVRYTGWRI